MCWCVFAVTCLNVSGMERVRNMSSVKEKMLIWVICFLCCVFNFSDQECLTGSTEESFIWLLDLSSDLVLTMVMSFCPSPGSGLYSSSQLTPPGKGICDVSLCVCVCQSLTMGKLNTPYLGNDIHELEIRTSHLHTWDLTWDKLSHTHTRSDTHTVSHTHTHTHAHTRSPTMNAQ